MFYSCQTLAEQLYLDKGLLTSFFIHSFVRSFKRFVCLFIACWFDSLSFFLVLEFVDLSLTASLVLAGSVASVCLFVCFCFSVVYQLHQAKYTGYVCIIFARIHVHCR